MPHPRRPPAAWIWRPQANAITSFKRLVLHVGPLDFSTDPEFLEEM